MARMYPDRPGDSTKSDAEKNIFNVIKAQMSDDWICLHSLGLTTHQRKTWAEADFVLIGPAGVFCLEVKGGRVSRKSGEWLFTNRHGETTAKKEGPFEQAAGESSALRNYIYDKHPDMRGALVQYGVVLPDVVFDNQGPDLEPGIVYDSRDREASFAAYIARLADHWSDRNLERRGRRPLALDSAKRLDLLKSLRCEFDLAPTMRAQIDETRRELVRLTEGQVNALRGLRDAKRALIRGGAGTGKTLLAIEEARRLQHQGRRCLLVCFNRQLAQWLSQATEGDELIAAQGLHALMRELILADPRGLEVPDPEDPLAFEQRYPELALSALLEGGVEREYDALVVDEGQDILRSHYLDVLDVLLKDGLAEGTWRVFLDPNQDLYGGMEPGAIERLDRSHPAPFTLTVNCRNTVPVAVETSILSGSPLGEILAAEGPDVRHHWFGTPEEHAKELDSAVRYYLDQGVRPDQIVVLSPRRMEASGIPSVLGGIQCVPRDKFQRGARILFSTIQAFKGLEADVVLLTGLGDLGGIETRAALYVGASRAMACLDIFMDASYQAAYQQRAIEFGSALAASGDYPVTE
jgi:hypothetical protein